MRRFSCRGAPSSRAPGVRSRQLVRPAVRQQRLAESLKQCSVDGIALRIVFGMPLHAECEARRVGNPDRLDRAILRHALDDHPFPRLEDALTVQRIDAYGLATEQPGEDPAGNETDAVTVCGDNR